MIRNEILINFLCGAIILMFAGHSIADDECHDYAIKTIDRLKMRFVSGISLSAQEIQCRKLARLRDKQANQDNRYFATQLTDHSFRDHNDRIQNSTISLNEEQKTELLTISISSTQKDGSEQRSIDTLRGFRSVTSEQ